MEEYHQQQQGGCPSDGNEQSDGVIPNASVELGCLPVASGKGKIGMFVADDEENDNKMKYDTVMRSRRLTATAFGSVAEPMRSMGGVWVGSRSRPGSW
jgi:hypothetical protein